MASQVIRWLHLSDFHVGKDGYAQRKMFEYIIGNVRKKKAEGFIPDFVFITGDLANKGLSSEYMDFWLEFLEPLQAEIGDGIEERIFVVPGNLDVDRTHSQAFSREEMSDGRSRYFDSNEEGRKLREMLMPRFRAFQDNDQTVAKGAFESTEGSYAKIVDIRGKKIGIAGINTAWLSKDDYDERKLTPGKELIESALKYLAGAELRIVLGHLVYASIEAKGR